MQLRDDAFVLNIRIHNNMYRMDKRKQLAARDFVFA